MQPDLLHALNLTFFNKRDDLNFLVVHFPSMCSNIQTAPVETMFGSMGIAFMNIVILYRVSITNEH